MTWLSSFWRSSIGGKVTMAVTGLMLFGFVVMHLLGNLQLFAGADKLNAYAKWLHDLGPLLWVARIGLLAIFVLHVATAIRLSRSNRAARPVAYQRPNTVQASMASRSMVLSGFSVLAFLIYHLAHFTFEVEAITPAFVRMVDVDGAPAKDVYAMVTKSFDSWEIVAAYAAFQIVLFLHLSHGMQSLAQTLGLQHKRYTPMIKTLSYVLALAIAGGNMLLALSVKLGLVEVN
jgi:succinate dehydrogenase / fumarate reductase cytochrome b subunit